MNLTPSTDRNTTHFDVTSMNGFRAGNIACFDLADGAGFGYFSTVTGEVGTAIEVAPRVFDVYRQPWHVLNCTPDAQPIAQVRGRLAAARILAKF